LRTLEAIERSETVEAPAYDGAPGLNIAGTVAAVAAAARAEADRGEQVLIDAFRALQNQSEGVARSYQAQIDVYQNTVALLQAHYQDVYESEEEILADLKVEKSAREKATEELKHTRVEFDRAKEQVQEFNARVAALIADKHFLTDQTTSLTTTNSDLRRANDVLLEQNFELKRDRDAFQLQAETIPSLQIDNATIRGQRDAFSKEAAIFCDMVKELKVQHTQALLQLREDFADRLAEAKERGDIKG